MAPHCKRASLRAALSTTLSLLALSSSVSSVGGFATPPPGASSSSYWGRPPPPPLGMADVAVADPVAAGEDVFNPENIR
jgi:hypothetical protein